jgi:hypothetical protein
MGMIPHSTEQCTNTSISAAQEISARKSRLILTRKNQKGQVAIFVALIFQVVFVFFALMINVGLLVHQKINLQHSTDLAAYYGAMKQAEELNAIAHINFQMRQAWKLWTWRYRILGTFGMMPRAGTTQSFPFNITGNSFQYNGSMGVHASKGSPYTNGDGAPINVPLNCSNMADPAYRVDGAAIGIQDVPFFCVGHAGFKAWPQGESHCNLACEDFTKAKVIDLIPSLATTYNTPWSNNMAGSVNQTISEVNSGILKKCEEFDKVQGTMFARFMAAFANESIARSETIKMLAANLSQDADIFVDIDGKSIKDGSRRTFENNLTGANFTGLNKSDSFRVVNGLSNSDCRFRNGDPEDGQQFLKRIEFKFINYFIEKCTGSGNSVAEQPEGVYQATDLSSAFRDVPSDLRNVVASFTNPQGYAMIGYEKNPNCVDYFAVKTYSEPSIPFLPMAKIKLEAIAVAKPFGGSIGPWYGTKWDLGETKSSYNDTDPDSKMDPTLPMRDFNGGYSGTLRESVYTQPNFSLFVGDRLGLRNLDYIAAFHSALVMRDINDYPGTNSSASKNTATTLANNGKWPDYINWNNIDNASGDFKQWESLATDDGEQAGMRALEIAAIAPNQYDIFHYSIDPDFYSNYYVRLYAGFDAIKNAAGNSVLITKDQLRPDFGARDMSGKVEQNPPMTPKSFSVKDQILVKNKVLNIRPSQYNGSPLPAGASGDTYNDFLNYLVSLQSSLLTGWTFLNYKDYKKFPMDPVNRLDNTMAFGQCDDEWNKTSAAINNKTDEKNFGTPMNVDQEWPPTAGNCITGGRTGYSVKLIAPNVIDGTNAVIKLANPIDPTFFQF